jgi:hypothetical protein
MNETDPSQSFAHLYVEHLYRYQVLSALLQRQKLRVVCVSDCAYTWENFEGRFWVYGKELAIYAPDYPQKYCWGCEIM